MSKSLNLRPDIMIMLRTSSTSAGPRPKTLLASSDFWTSHEARIYKITLEIFSATSPPPLTRCPVWRQRVYVPSVRTLATIKETLSEDLDK